MGGGALPIAYNKKNKKVYLLFGKENEYLNKDSPGFSDFGGGEKPGESALDTALREGCEELNGFFGCEGEIKRLIKENLVTSLNHDRYTTFLFEIEYDENLPYYFNNNYKFLKGHVNKLVRHATNGLFEKSVIKWMTFDDLRNERGSFRSYYRNVVDVILENEDDIVAKVTGEKERTATVPTTPTTTRTPTTRTATATTRTATATTRTATATTRTPTTRTPTTVRTATTILKTPKTVKSKSRTRTRTRTRTKMDTMKKTNASRYNNYKYDADSSNDADSDSDSDSESDKKKMPLQQKQKQIKGKGNKKNKTKKNKKWFELF
jgi:hypothetical protein